MNVVFTYSLPAENVWLVVQTGGGLTHSGSCIRGIVYDSMEKGKDPTTVTVNASVRRG